MELGNDRSSNSTDVLKYFPHIEFKRVAYAVSALSGDHESSTQNALHQHKNGLLVRLLDLGVPRGLEATVVIFRGAAMRSRG